MIKSSSNNNDDGTTESERETMSQREREREKSEREHIPASVAIQFRCATSYTLIRLSSPAETSSPAPRASAGEKASARTDMLCPGNEATSLPVPVSKMCTLPFSLPVARYWDEPE